MPKVHYVKREWLENNALMMLAESSAVGGNNIDRAFSSPTDRRNDAIGGHSNASSPSNNIMAFQFSSNLVDEDELPKETYTIHPIEADTMAMHTMPTPPQEGNTVMPIQNIPKSSQHPAFNFQWNIHADKVLIDYCSYFLNSDGSIGDEKWSPLAHELGTSAASCKMRWHVLKGSASQEAWEQQQQYLRQQLRHSVHQQGHQISALQHTNVKPTRAFQALHSSSAAPMELEYFNTEFDAYLQRVLWDDDDFVRAVDAIHHQREKVISPARA